MKKLPLSLIIYLIFNYINNIITISDYCDSSLCNGAKHIGCGNIGEISPICNNTAKIVDLSSVKDFIIDLHNQCRNNVALGRVPKLEPAVRMATMEWDDELAYLAELNAKTCDFEHDQCRNTKNYKYSGQNLAYVGTRKFPTLENTLKALIASWYEEYKNCDMSYINNFRLKSKNKDVGHFTEMINDRNIKMGCGLLDKKEKGFEIIIFVCNYSTDNIIGYKIYKSGQTASQCTKGINEKYPGLCHPNEPIDPNEIY